MRVPTRHIPYEAFEHGEENVRSDPESLNPALHEAVSHSPKATF